MQTFASFEIDKILDSMETMGSLDKDENALILETTKQVQKKFKDQIREFRAQHVSNPVATVVVDESLINQLTKELLQLTADLQTLKNAVPLLQDRLVGWSKLYRQTTDFESHLSIDYRDLDYRI